MNLSKLSIVALGFFAALPAAFADQVRINCALDQAPQKAFVKVLKNDGEPAQVSLYQNGREVVEVSGPDVEELNAGIYHLNVVAAHHNTVIKVVSDLDTFGGDTRKEGEETWKGYVYVSDNLAKGLGGKHVFKTTCYFDI